MVSWQSVRLRARTVMAECPGMPARTLFRRFSEGCLTSGWGVAKLPHAPLTRNVRYGIGLDPRFCLQQCGEHPDGARRRDFAHIEIRCGPSRRVRTPRAPRTVIGSGAAASSFSIYSFTLFTRRSSTVRGHCPVHLKLVHPGRGGICLGHVRFSPAVMDEPSYVRGA